MSKPLVKLSRSAMRSWTIGHLQTKQDGNCVLCGKPIDLTVMGNRSDYVVDHCHDTGEIRGILHRSCNQAEGKVRGAVGRWGCKVVDYSEIIPWLKNLVTYLEEAHTGLMYPDHKTPEQKAERSRVKRNTAAAARRAAIKVAKERSTK